MTKNKARKAATRARAAATGERYVVARRAIELKPSTGSDGLLHRLTHRVPGVPAHAPRKNRPHVRTARGRQQHGEPRVLVGWQNRIARLVRGR